MRDKELLAKIRALGIEFLLKLNELAPNKEDAIAFVEGMLQGMKLRR